MLDVGIISAKRDPSTIGQMLDSYFDNFSERPFVFREPDAGLFAGQSKVLIHQNDAKLGCFYNWLSALEKMYMWTQSEYIMMLEDDIIFQDGAGQKIRDYLTFDQGELISPYCSLVNRPHGKGWQPSNLQRYGLCGSLCTVMSRAVAKQVLDNRSYLIEESKGIHLDTAIGKLTQKLDLTLTTHNPTLVQHIGHTSTWIKNNGSKTPETFNKARLPAL